MDFKEAAREVGSVFIIHPRSFPNFRRSESGSLLNFYFPIKLWDEILEPVGEVNSWAKKGEFFCQYITPIALEITVLREGQKADILSWHFIHLR